MGTAVAKTGGYAVCSVTILRARNSAVCPDCSGQGFRWLIRLENCPACGGGGRVGRWSRICGRCGIEHFLDQPHKWCDLVLKVKGFPRQVKLDFLMWLLRLLEKWLGKE